MTRLYWCYAGGQVRPYTIAVAAASDPVEARELFDEPAQCVHELTSPDVLAQVGPLEPGRMVAVTVESLPSAYDQFRRGGSYRDMDWQAMEDAGFNVL